MPHDEDVPDPPRSDRCHDGQHARRCRRSESLSDPVSAEDRWRDTRFRIRNRLMRWAYNERFHLLWAVVQRVRPLERWTNRFLVNQGVGTVPARPYPLSTVSDSTSWQGLTDRTYNARELPPLPGPRRSSPPSSEVLELFRRTDYVECPKSTVLFAYVAQWFTDGFLRSDRSVVGKDKRDIRRNESSHEVDLAQVYGLTPQITECCATPRTAPCWRTR